MSLATYLRDRLPSACVRTAALGLVVLALAAYGVESGVLAFVAVVFLAGEATALLLDFWRRRGFYRRLDRTMEGLGEHGVGYLAPELTQEPSTLEEAAFLDALRQASKSMADQVAAMRAEQRDYRDYVETWVHEVKTPIAAGRLVAANNPGPATDAPRLRGDLGPRGEDPHSRRAPGGRQQPRARDRRHGRRAGAH